MFVVFVKLIEIFTGRLFTMPGGEKMKYTKATFNSAAWDALNPFVSCVSMIHCIIHISI